MTASSLQVTPGSGLRLATNSYTEGAVTVHDEKVILGEQYLPSYTLRAASVSTATLDSHLLQIMGRTSLQVYLRRIRVYQQVVATTAALVTADIVRLTTAGTGGTVITASLLDTTDPSGTTGMTLPTAKGTEGEVIDSAIGYFLQTISASLGAPQAAIVWDFDWTQLRSKSLRIPAGTSNGIALKIRNATAGAQVLIVAEFTEASF